MAETMNLGLDITGEAGDARLARVYLVLARSYLKGQGAPTLTDDCASFADFEREINRLKEECDELLERAREEFGDATQGGADAGEIGSPKTAEAPHPADKTLLRVGDDLCVEDEMTRDVKTVQRNDMLLVADELMKVGGFRHVVVVEDDNSDAVAGIISHRDIFYGALAWSLGQGEASHHKALDTMPVKDVMRSDVTTVASDTPLVHAARIMLEKKIGCLPVMRNKRIVGILTEGDFLSMLTSAGQGKAEQPAPVLT
jgi:CBS domain-containing membrane protein